MNKNIVRIVGLTFGILLIPLIAMQFTSEVQWTGSDFLAMGILLFGFGMIWELIARRLKTTQQKVMAGVGVFVAFLIVWVQLAVGIV